MTTQQPVWKFAGHIGDVDPVSYGGGFVYVDETRVYPPELVWLDPASDEEWAEKEDAAEVTVYRFPLDPPRFKTLTEAGKASGFSSSHELPASERGKTWEWYAEWYVSHAGAVAESTGQSAFSLLRSLASKDPMRRASGYWDLVGYFGAYEFDSYPVKMTEAEARERYAAELTTCR